MRAITIVGIAASLIWLVAVFTYGGKFDRQIFPDMPNMSDTPHLYYIVSEEVLIWLRTAHCDDGGSVDLDISRHPIPGAAANRLTVCGSPEQRQPWTQAAIDSGARDADLKRLSVQILNINRFRAVSGILPTAIIGFIALAPLLMIGMIALIRSQLRRGSAKRA